MDDSVGFHRLPSVDALLRTMPRAVERWGHRPVSRAVRRVIDDARDAIAAGEAPDIAAETLRGRALDMLAARDHPTLKPVFNLTGTVLHTNLGRAALPAEALTAIGDAAAPTNLEFDLQTGTRGDRDAHVASLICELTGAEAATAVNNNAAAVLLVLNTLALNREVPVSRGELVEIGGSFRIPDIMSRSGCRLVEVGATNRTHLRDYRGALNDQTALLMKVHTSNYRIQGFTRAVAEAELAPLAREQGLPLVTDLGSGNLVDFAPLGLPDEPTARAVLAGGADLVTFSGDKLLGGPQAGLIAGRADLVEAINANPLKRALRLDKLSLAALAEVLKLLRDPDLAVRRLPTLRYLTRRQADIAAQAQHVLPPVQRALEPAFAVTAADCKSQIGSGSLPVNTLPSAALRIEPLQGDDADLRGLAASLRQLPRPVIGRLQRGALWLDLRCLDDEAAFLAAVALLRS